MLDSCKQLFAESHATAQAEALDLRDRRNAGDVCAFRSTIQNRVVAGRILDFSATTVTVEVCSVRPKGDDELYGLAFDDATRRAAKKLGFHIPAGRRQVLRRGDYDLMSTAEFERWIVESVKPHRRDVTLSIPSHIEGAQVSKLIPRLVDGVLSSQLVTTYAPPRSRAVRCTMRLRIRR